LCRTARGRRASGPSPGGRRALWLKDFELSEKELASLEVEIQNGGQGKEKESARRWMEAHPDVVARMAPVTG
jgi:glycine betaine/proline transport system permease protein/glycine betaine/proline transport system substrate-binding protein